MAKPKIVLTKKFVLTSDTLLLILSALLIYIYKIDLFSVSFSLSKFVICLILGFILSGLFSFLERKSKSFKHESKWIYPNLDNTWGLIEFPIIVAVAQEIFFRGILQLPLGFILSSLLFSIYNFWPGKSSWSIILFGFLFGLLANFVYLWWPNIVYPITLHASFHIFNRYKLKK